VAFEFAKQRERHILRLARNGQQGHTGFFRRAPAFAVIAVATGSHHIFPGRLTAAGTRHHVIDCQVGATRLRPAVLTRFPVAQQDAAP
jgi:hypothetical protein